MTKTKLYNYKMSNVTLSDAIKQCNNYLENAIAFLYSPKNCLFAKLDKDGNLINSQNDKVDLNYHEHYIFESRIFNEFCELRWLNNRDGEGDAVLITQIEVTELSDYLIKLNENKPIIDTIHQQYLLWGENANNSPSDGCLRLSTARIGKVEIPFNDTLKDHHRVYLNTVEYLAEIDDYGNVAVIEERLVNLSQHPLSSNKT